LLDVLLEDALHLVLDMEFLLLQIDRLRPFVVLEDRLPLELGETRLVARVLIEEAPELRIALGELPPEILVVVHHRSNLPALWGCGRSAWVLRRPTSARNSSIPDPTLQACAGAPIGAEAGRP